MSAWDHLPPWWAPDEGELAVEEAPAPRPGSDRPLRVDNTRQMWRLGVDHLLERGYITAAQAAYARTLSDEPGTADPYHGNVRAAWLAWLLEPPQIVGWR